MLEEKNLDENISRIENVRELKTNIIAFVNENGGSLFDFLSETALYTDLDRDDQSTNRVLLMTMHSAKGLEFDTVFIVGAEEGIFPGVRAIGEPGEMEEERRLCYVAMTRAKRKLYFTSARRRMLFGRTSASEPSRFIREISDENIKIYEPVNDFFDFERNQTRPGSNFGFPIQRTTRSQHAALPVRQKTPPPTPPASFNKGDIVDHKTFGRGIILNVSPAGGDALLEIAFDEAGTKRFMQNSAIRYLTKG